MLPEHRLSRKSYLKATILNLFRKIRNNLVRRFAVFPGNDKEKMLSTQGNFIFDELTERAAASADGVANTTLKIPYLPFATTHFVVSTKRAFLEEAAVYGEFDPKAKDRAQFDSSARKPFDILQTFVGTPLIINQNNENVKRERTAVMTNLEAKEAGRVARNEFEAILNSWDPKQDIKLSVQQACINILAKTWLNIQDVPDEMRAILTKAEEVIFNYDNVDPFEFYRIKDQLKSVGDKYILRNSEQILQKGYLSYLNTQRHPRHFKDLNGLAALIVEGNLSTLMNCAILQIASDPGLQKRLQTELSEMAHTDPTKPDFSANLKKLPLLHKIYLESLRFFSPAAPIARYASKATKIAGITIPKGSYIFVPLRRIMHDPKEWRAPNVFNPDRPELDQIKINTYPLVPFSVGKRMCPAATGFTEALFKNALFTLFKDHSLSLEASNKTLETIAVNQKQPRLKQPYFGHITPIDTPANAAATKERVKEKEGDHILFNYGTPRARPIIVPTLSSLSPPEIKPRSTPKVTP